MAKSSFYSQNGVNVTEDLDAMQQLADEAAASAAAAATSETGAGNSATAAAASATAAASSASAAATSASTASAAQVAAAAARDDAQAAEAASEAAADTVAFRWTFDSATGMADPGTGELRLDNATLASVTNIAVSALLATAGNPDTSAFIVTWDDSTSTPVKGTLIIRDASAPVNFAVYSITGSITDNGTWLQIPVTHVDSSGSFSGDLVVTFDRAGNAGTSAVDSVFGRTGVVVATAGDYTATQITNTPAGNISSVTVQAALNELDTEKAAASHTHVVADITDAGTLAALSSVGTSQIDDDAVTYAKMQNIATDRLLGRDTAATGNPEELTVGGGIEFTGTGGIQTSAFTGDVTKTAGGTALTIASDAVTFAKMQNITTDRLLGRDTAATGDPEELTVGGGIEFTGSGGIRTGAFTGDVTKTAGGTALTIANDAVTYAKMQNVSAASKLIGRGSASGSGDPEEIALGTGLSMSGTTLNVSGGGLVPIERINSSSVASYDFLTGINSTYRSYVVIGHLLPATDQVPMWMRCSDDGSTFEADASDYDWLNAGNAMATGAAYYATGDDADSEMEIYCSTTNFLIGNASTEGIVFAIFFHAPSSTSLYKRFNGSWNYGRADGGSMHGDFSGTFRSAAAMVGLRLMFSSGNIASGDVTLYGIANS